MARSKYDKTTRALMRDMLADLKVKPGQVITTSRVLQWFAERYPDLKPNSLRAHLVQASTNDPNRLHHSSTDTSDDLLFKVDKSQFRLYEPDRDPAPIHELVEGDVAREEELERERDDEEGDASESGNSTEFLLERDLQRYLAQNLSIIEPGLKLYKDESGEGIEFDVGGRRVDILGLDKHGALVVLELKVSRGYDCVVGQLLRYMNWLRQNLAEPGQRVRGVVVCRTVSEDLRLACASISNIELFEYKLSVAVAKIPTVSFREEE